MTQTPIMKQRCIYLYRSPEGESTKVPLQEHSSNCLLCHINSKAMQASEMVKVQLVLCEDLVRLKIIILRTSHFQRSVKQLSSNCYCLCKGGITNELIVVLNSGI